MKRFRGECRKVAAAGVTGLADRRIGRGMGPVPAAEQSNAAGTGWDVGLPPDSLGPMRFEVKETDRAAPRGPGLDNPEADAPRAGRIPRRKEALRTQARFIDESPKIHKEIL